MNSKRGLLMNRRQLVAPSLRVRVPQYMYFFDFGVREYHSRHHHHTLAEGQSAWKQRGRFICTGVPGTGFFERITESDAYEQMVQKYTSMTTPSLLRHLMGREFSFDKEMKAVDAALNVETHALKKSILSAYGNCLALAKQAEELERIVLGLKKEMHHMQTKALSAAINHYRNQVAQLESEMKICQVSLKDLASPEQVEHYKAFCEKFAEVMESRRMWSMTDKGNGLEMKRVFMDLGVFDFMCPEQGTPVMRDADGVCYYLFPNYMVRARSTVDFDVIDVNAVTIDYREASGEAFTLNRTSSAEVFGRSLGEVYFRELDKSFYFAHRSVARKLVHYMHDYQRSV